MNKLLAKCLRLGLFSLVLAVFSAHAAESSGSAEKSKPIEAVVKPSIAKPSDALVSKSKDASAASTSPSRDATPSAQSPATSVQTSSSGALQASPSASPQQSPQQLPSPSGSQQTPGGRVINDLKVMPGTLSVPKNTATQVSPSAQTSPSDPLEDKVRVLLQDKLGRDGEVVLRVSPDTPVGKSEGVSEPRARQAKQAPALAVKDDTVRTQEQSDAVKHTDTVKHASSQRSLMSARYEPWDWAGPNGPQSWGRLDPSYASCSNGKLQSPPSITPQQVIAATGPEMPQLNWQMQGFRWSRQGPLWTADLDAGSQASFRGEVFSLESIQFRVPGEPFVGKKAPAGAIHLIHRLGNRFLIIAVPLEIDDKSPINPAIATLLRRFPYDGTDTPNWTGLNVHPQALLPNPMPAAILFSGSLSHPPCSETVLWLIAQPSLTLSKSQWTELAKLIGEGARPLQPLQGRPVLAIGSVKR